MRAIGLLRLPCFLPTFLRGRRVLCKLWLQQYLAGARAWKGPCEAGPLSGLLETAGAIRAPYKEDVRRLGI